MNRKYRAWDKQNEYWLDEDEVVIHPDGIINVYDKDTDTWHTNGPIDIVFFTGLLDSGEYFKDGHKETEIYEGDIVEIKDGITHSHGGEIHSHNFRGVVIWDEKDCCFCLPDWCRGSRDSWLYAIKGVVGNKFENPELLNEK